MDTVCGSLASQPPWHLLLHPSPLSPPLAPSPLAFYLISSSLVTPLSPAFTHVCQRKGRLPWYVCAPKRLHSATSARLYSCTCARIRFSHENVLKRKRRGEVEQELGGMEVSEARCTDHDCFSFVKCHAE